MSLRIGVRLLATGLGIGLLGLRPVLLDPSSVLLAAIAVAGLGICGWSPARRRA